MGLSIYDERSPFLSLGTLAVADATNWKTIVPAAQSALRVDAILVNAGKATSTIVECAYYITGTQLRVGSVTVPANAGYGGVIPFDIVAAIAVAAIGGYNVPIGGAFQVRVPTTLGAIEYLDFTAIGGYV